MERLYALLLLAWALVQTLTSGLFGTRRGLGAFRKSYAADRLPAVTPEERRLLPMLSGCIACGLCDVGEASRMEASKGQYAGAMDLVLASSRSMPDYDAALGSLAHVSSARLAELEMLCPTRVPIRQVAEFIRAKGGEVVALATSGAHREIVSDRK